jgi:hypothetical protein
MKHLSGKMSQVKNDKIKHANDQEKKQHVRYFFPRKTAFEKGQIYLSMRKVLFICYLSTYSVSRKMKIHRNNAFFYGKNGFEE